jgi:hypothetical protein
LHVDLGFPIVHPCPVAHVDSAATFVIGRFGTIMDGSLAGVDVTARSLPDGWMALTVCPTNGGAR